MRQFIVIDIEKLTTNCGYGVPEMRLARERPTLAKWADSKTDAELEEYKKKNNLVSMDGLSTGLKV